MDIHGKDHRLQNATVIDAGFLRVECPTHLGILIPVTDSKFVIQTMPVEGRPRRRDYNLYLEALCRWCGKYHYLKVSEGRSTLRWDA